MTPGSQYTNGGAAANQLEMYISKLPTELLVAACWTVYVNWTTEHEFRKSLHNRLTP